MSRTLEKDPAAGLRALLEANPFVRSFVYVESTASTLDETRRLAEAGAPSGTVVVAGSQTAGRGRLHRSWFSPPGLGVYLSVLVRPGAPVQEPTRWTILSSLAVCEACRELSGAPVAIKWPNDLLHDGRKLAGTLVELRESGSRGSELAIGTGINVNHTEDDFPPELAERATSLRIVAGGAPLDRDWLTASYLEQLAARTGQLERGAWETIRGAWQRCAPGSAGARVRVLPPAGSSDHAPCFGTTRGLDPAGALRVETDDGRTVTLRDGDRVAPLES